MAERVQLATRTSESKKENSASTIRKTESPQSMSSAADRVLYLQRTIGNQAVQRLIKSGTLQAKLKIGQPGDKYEQEADRVVDALMQMPEPGVQRQEEPEEEEETLLAKSLAEEITPLVQRQVEPEEEDEELQAKATSGRFSEVNSNLESHIQYFKGGGQALSENDRAFFEPRFGRDFSQVRLHTDTQAAESTRRVNAQAFTMGQEVVFGAGQYAQGTSQGRRLMAHELTHVVQQSRGGAPPSLQSSDNCEHGTEKASASLWQADEVPIRLTGESAPRLAREAASPVQGGGARPSAYW
jgi:hypothetical protein